MEFLVVDGQQRLTTLSLLLCAIRDHRARTEDPTHRDRINEQYLFMRLPTRGKAVYQALWLPLQNMLSSSELEQLFWLDLVQRDPRVKQTETYIAQQARLDRFTSETDIEEEIKRFGWRPRSGVNERTGVGSLQDRQVTEGRTHARGTPSIPCRPYPRPH